MVITILDPKSHTTPDTVHVPMNWSSRFWIQSLIRLLYSYELVITIFCSALQIFMLSTHHDFVPISRSARITISCQFHVQHASRSCMIITADFRVRPRITFSFLPRLAQIPTSLKQW